jgi:hypothetical protein
MKLLPLVEAPDRVVHNGEWIKNHAMNDARSFIIGDTWIFIGMDATIKHPHFIQKSIQIFKDMGIEPSEAIDIDVDSFKNHLKRYKIRLIGDFDKFAKEYPTISDLEDYVGESSARLMGYSAGRLWTKDMPVASFWDGPKKIKANLTKIEKGLKMAKINLKNFHIDYLGNKGDGPLPTYQEFKTGKIKSKMSKQEILNAMSKAHVDPKEKQKLIDLGIMGRGQTRWERASQLTGIPVIQLKQKMTTSESSMRLSNLIKETPDEVFDNGKRVHRWQNGYTFIMGKDWIFIAGDMSMHSDMSESISSAMWLGVYETLSDEDKANMPTSVIEKTKITHQMKDDIFEELEENLIEFFGNWNSFLKQYPNAGSVGKDATGRNTGLFQGRLWTDKPKTISFWQKSSKVKSNISSLEKIFKLAGENIKEYNIDTVDNEKSQPLTHYKDFTSSKSSSKKLSEKEVKDLLAKQHVDPKAKKKLRDLGFVGRGESKWEEMSRKTGIPVIKLKQMTTTSEQSMKLSDMIQESPDGVMANGKWAHAYGMGGDHGFIMGNDWMVFGPKTTHDGMQYQLENAHYYVTKKPSKPFQPEHEDGFKKYLKSKNVEFVGNFKSFIKEYPTEFELNKAWSREMGVMTGRFWKKKPKTISFWAKYNEVKKKLKTIEKVFKLAKINLKEYKFDYVDHREELPSASYEEMSGSNKLKIKNISEKELQDLFADQHNDPKAKQILRDLGLVGRGESQWEKASTTSESRISLTDIMIEQEHKEFVKFVHQHNLLNHTVTLNEFSVPSKLKNVIGFVKDLASKTKFKVKDVIKLFMDSKVYKLFAKLGWSMTKLFDLAKKGMKHYKDAVHAVGEYVSKTGAGKWTAEKLKGLDEFLKKHPKTRKIAGIALAALLIYMWLNMTFIGDFDYDFDLSHVIEALHGKYSLVDIFSGTAGATFITLFLTGSALGLTFPWPGPTHIKFVTGVLYGLSKLVKQKLSTA